MSTGRDGGSITCASAPLPIWTTSCEAGSRNPTTWSDYSEGWIRRGLVSRRSDPPRGPAVVTLTPDDLVDAASFLAAIERECPGVVPSEGSGDWFVLYDPDGRTIPEQRFPFLTIVTGDRYDAASFLDRDARTYRVNLGVDSEAYEELLGPAPRQPAGYEVIDTGVDYTATDVLMPHPFYAPLHWVCVVDPGEGTRSELAALVDRAYALAARRYANRRRHRT